MLGTRPHPDVQVEGATHAHRWRIEEPNGELSHGQCRICGVRRDFRNWLESGDFLTNEERRSAL